MENKLKLVEYSDSESEGEDSQVNETENFQITDAQGRQVAVVEPTPQQEIESDAESNNTGEFLAEEDDPLSTQATAGSSQEIASSGDIELARNEDPEVILSTDSSQSTIVVSPPRETDEQMSHTKGNS